MEILDGGDVVVGLRPDIGGRVASIVVRGHELLRASADRPIDWGLFPMAPFAGRIGRGHVTFDDVETVLPLTLPPHAIHGTLVTRPWRLTGDGVMEVALADPWPWAGAVRHEVSIDGLQVVLRLTVTAEERMPAWLGWHPWFRRSLSSGERADVSFEARARHERSDDHLPTGRLVAVGEGPWDDAMVDVRNIVATWSRTLRMELLTDCSLVVVFDEPDDAFCLEPQTAPPDALALGVAPVLEPGESAAATMRLRFSDPD